MNEITFNAWIARDDINDEYYPRTFLFDKKPHREPIVYWGEVREGCTWHHDNGKLGSYKFKELLPELKYKDEPVEVEITIKIKEK